MSGAKLLAWRGRIAALGRGCVALITALAVLAPSVVWAGVPYRIHWAFLQEDPTCERARLHHDGDVFFQVNETPLPTYEIPGAFKQRDDGSESNAAEAEFASVLLRMGENDFRFHVTNSGGDNTCVHAQNVVSLVSEPLGLNKPLFDVRRDGTAFDGATALDLSLEEINPPLARDIESLRVTIAEQRKRLLENASKVADLAEKQDLLQQLDTELNDLVRRPLDEIGRTDLDAILDRYADVVDPETKAALEQLIDDLKQSVADLETEMARLIDEFGAQADAAADFATQAARDTGWNPDDPSGYALGPSDVPWVEVPDISDVPGAFEPGRDPYAAYADAVIASLEADTSDGHVAERADFVANVRAWRANTVALEEALRERAGVSLAETNAFLNAQNRVTGYVRRFMDASDWFVDAPVPADVREAVDGVLKRAFDDLADHMKDDLNIWPASEGIDLEHTQLFQMIDAFAGGMSAIGEGAQAYVDVMGTLVHATSRVAIGFVPYVGPALDLCECITGKEWCLPSGKELSTEERIFSGIGFSIAGGAPLWRGMKGSGGLRPAAQRVVGSIEEIDEAVARALRANRRTWYKTLRGAVTSVPMNDFEKKVAKYMLDEGRALIGVGDDGVRRVLGIPMNSTVRGEASAPDFITVTLGEKLVVSEAKGGIEVDFLEFKPQLKRGMQGVRDKGLIGDVGPMELFMEQGAKFKDRNLIVKDGYLYSRLKNQAVTFEGLRQFVRVIRL